jgi:hypothetical protein
MSSHQVHQPQVFHRNAGSGQSLGYRTAAEQRHDSMRDLGVRLSRAADHRFEVGLGTSHLQLVDDV